MKKKRTADRPTDDVLQFLGTIDSAGYKWERREDPPESADRSHASTVLGATFGGDYMVGRGGETKHYVLRCTNGATWMHDGGRSVRCYPTFELANSVNSEEGERDRAISFVSKYGMLHDYREIELQEFIRIAFEFVSVLQTLQRCNGHALGVRGGRLDFFVGDGGGIARTAQTLRSFCRLELMELVRLQRAIKKCALCDKWYATERRPGSGRGKQGPEALRFCSYGSCRQKAHAVTPCFIIPLR